MYQLLGGAEDRVPVYATFGLSEYSLEELVEVAKLWVREGHTRLKMVVGAEKVSAIPNPEVAAVALRPAGCASESE